jgi:hypothetical protein
MVSLILYALFVLGLIVLALLFVIRSRAARQLIFAAGVVVINLGTLLVLVSVYLLFRLDGSQPPSLLEVVRLLWVQLALIALVNVGLVAAAARIFSRRAV